MVQTKGKLGFNLVERSKPTKDSFDYRTGPTQRWVEELPMGNIGETAKQIYQTLQEVNRLDIPWKARLAFLELFREPVSYVQSTLLRHYTGMSFPIPPKAQRIAMLAQTLYLEMALGYKITLEEMPTDNFLTRDNRAIAQVIHRALRYLSQAIIKCYQVYTHYPQSSWREIHQLYLYAKLKKLEKDAVQDNLDQQAPKSSISRIYKQILLLALASPYRLRQGEAEAIYSLSANWAGHAHILPLTHQDADKALFVIPTDSDEGPDYLSFRNRECTDATCALLDTSQVGRIMTEDNNPSKNGASISVELLSQLKDSWTTVPSRNNDRKDQQSSIELVVGITMLHQALAKDLGDSVMQRKRASYESKPIVAVSQPTKDDIWNPFIGEDIQKKYEAFSKQLLKEKGHIEAKAKSEPEQQPQPSLLIQQWEIRNESAGGYRIALADEQNCKIQVGEIVGIRHQDRDTAWQVGVVRWARQGADTRLEVGIELLATHARPSMAKNEKGSGNAAEFQYAILLSGMAEGDQPPSIITPIRLFQPGNEVILQVPDNQVNVRLEKSIKDGGSFVQFTYVVLGKMQQDTPAAPKGALDDVWSDL